MAQPYTIGDAVRYINEAVDEAEAHADSLPTGDDEIVVRWPTQTNRVEVYKHLIEKGWVVTSTDGLYVYFEPVSGLDGIELADDENGVSPNYGTLNA